MVDLDDDEDDGLGLHEMVVGAAAVDAVLGDDEDATPAGPVGPATRVDTPEGPVYVGTVGPGDAPGPPPPGRATGCGCSGCGCGGTGCALIAVLLLFLLAGLFRTLCEPLF